jgi:hypothetical protein
MPELLKRWSTARVRQGSHAPDGHLPQDSRVPPKACRVFHVRTEKSEFARKHGFRRTKLSAAQEALQGKPKIRVEFKRWFAVRP